MEFGCNCILQNKTTLIIACDGNFNIGNKGEMLFRIPTDLANYKSLTMGMNLYCGRKTFMDMGPLPGRHISVLSRKKVEGADRVIHSFEEFRKTLLADPKGYLVGGAHLVDQLYPDIGKILMTRVSEKFEADVGIDDPETRGFFIKKESPLFEEVGLHYKFVEYQRYMADKKAGK